MKKLITELKVRYFLMKRNYLMGHYNFDKMLIVMLIVISISAILLLLPINNFDIWFYFLVIPGLTLFFFLTLLFIGEFFGMIETSSMYVNWQKDSGYTIEEIYTRLTGK